MAWADSLGIFTHRQPFLLTPLLEAYTQKTGVEFQTVYAPKGLAQRLQAEGSRTKADLVLTVDISRIKELADAELLAPMSSDIINRQVPANLVMQMIHGQRYRYGRALLLYQKTVSVKRQSPPLKSLPLRNGRGVSVRAKAVMYIIAPCWPRWLHITAKQKRKIGQPDL